MKPLLKKIDGILLLDKPLHMTSNGALQRVKRLFGAKKAGHTGSLDPLATGMLPICFGEATKVSQFLLDSDKEYQVEATLGIKTTTGDAEGEVTATRPTANVTLTHIQQAIVPLLGTIQQIPPMFSALKHQGRPLYELARKGIEVERPARTVTIHALHVLGYEETRLRFTVHCSKGTYVRTLVEDLGEALGCGAHVTALRRLSVTPYQRYNMYSLAELETLQAEKGADFLTNYLLAIDTSVQQLPALTLPPSTLFYFRNGQTVTHGHSLATGFVRIFAENGQFVGIGEVLIDKHIAPCRLLSSVNLFSGCHWRLGDLA